jgi:myo-inositol-1(or 4)-monophosphatase
MVNFVTQPPLDEFKTFACRLAKASGELISKYYRGDYDVDLKSDESPVTVADRQAEQQMRAMIAQAYPCHGVLGEEFGHHQPDAEYQWVLDPIDGTKSFIAHSYLFGTLIALLRRGRPILGVIHQPIIGDFLLGDGDSAWLNGKRVQVRPCQRIEDAWLIGTEHWNIHRYQNGSAFDALSQRVKQYRSWGDCHGYYIVAVGGADIMLDPIMNTWDLMALVPIIQGAGGRITDWQGNNILNDANSSVATAGVIHDQVIAALNP